MGTPGRGRFDPRHGRPTAPARRRWVALCLALVLLVAGGSPAAAQTPAPAADAWLDVLPSDRTAVIDATERDISRYVMDIAVDESAGTIGGTMAVEVVNRYGEALDEVVLRLFPNGDHYGAGGTTVRDVTVDGRPGQPVLSVGDTVLSVPLPEPLPPGERLRLALAFTTTVPTDSTGSYGILSRVSATDEWVLADWYPSLAGYEPAPGPGWRRDPPFDGVDPTFGDVALYDVTLQAPGYTVQSTGTPVSDPRGGVGEGATRIVAGPARDFTLVLGTGWRTVDRTVGDTLVRYATTLTDDAAVDAVLDVVAGALGTYDDLLGRYPYRELDLVDVPLTPGTLGISWSGLVFLDGPSVAASADDRQYLDFLLAHEVAHQWWGGLIGGNSNDHTFITEGLTNYTMTVAVERTEGRAAAVDMLRTSIAPRYLTLLRAGGDSVADVPYPDAPDTFSDIVYGKAALGFLAIRERIGDEAFFAALHAFAADPDGTGGFRFQVAEPEDLLAAFERGSGENLDALWDRWFRQAVTTPAEVDALIDRYAGQ